MRGGNIEDFHDLMQELLRYMQIEPQQEATPEVYSFLFDGDIEMRIFSRQPGTLELVSDVGIVHNPKAHTVLLDLLALNRYTRDGPCLAIGLDPSTGMATLWTRRPFARLRLDDLTDLIKAVLARVALGRERLNTKPTGTPGDSPRHQRRFLTSSDALTTRR